MAYKKATKKLATKRRKPAKVRRLVRRKNTQPYGGKKELKYLDFPSPAYGAPFNLAVGTGGALECSTTGTLVCLNSIPQGTDNITRDGRNWLNRSIKLQGRLYPISAANMVKMNRIMLIWDSCPNNTALTAATLPALLFNGGTPALAYHALPNIDQGARFKVLWDNRITTSGFGTTGGSDGGSPETRTIDYYRKLGMPSIGVNTTATAGNAADLSSGALYLYTCGNQASATADVFTVNARLRFTE